MNLLKPTKQVMELLFDFYSTNGCPNCCYRNAHLSIVLLLWTDPKLVGASKSNSMIQHETDPSSHWDNIHRTLTSISPTFPSMPLDSSTHLHITENLQWIVNLPTHRSVGCGRKLEHVVAAHKVTDEHQSTRTALENLSCVTRTPAPLAAALCHP